MLVGARRRLCREAAGAHEQGAGATLAVRACLLAALAPDPAAGRAPLDRVDDAGVLGERVAEARALLRAGGDRGLGGAAGVDSERRVGERGGRQRRQGGVDRQPAAWSWLAAGRRAAAGSWLAAARGAAARRRRGRFA